MSSLLVDGPLVKVSCVSLTRDERAVFLRPGNFAKILTGTSSSDVGWVEDDLEWGVFRRCKADAGVAEEDPCKGSESESESRTTLGLRRVRVRVLTWGEERRKSSADTLLGGEWPSTDGCKPPKTSTSSIAVGAIAFILSSFDASSSAFETKGVVTFKSSSSSRRLSPFLHENSNFGNDCGLPSSSQLIEISQSEKCGGELGGTSSERPGGAVLCILSREAELGARDELGASRPLEVGPSSRRRPYVLTGRRICISVLDLESDCGEDERVESATKECSFPKSISKNE